MRKIDKRGKYPLQHVNVNELQVLGCSPVLLAFNCIKARLSARNFVSSGVCIHNPLTPLFLPIFGAESIP